MAKRPPIPVEQLSDESRRLYDVINSDSDLAIILIATSFIDAALRSLLEIRLLPGSTSERLLAHNGALGTLRARADLCYCLSLVTKKQYNEILVFSEIRNQVAHHHLQLDFTDPELAKLASKLKPYVFGTLEESLRFPRNRFRVSAVMVVNGLLIRALELKRTASTTL